MSPRLKHLDKKPAFSGPIILGAKAPVFKKSLALAAKDQKGKNVARPKGNSQTAPLAKSDKAEATKEELIKELTEGLPGRLKKIMTGNTRLTSPKLSKAGITDVIVSEPGIRSKVQISIPYRFALNALMSRYAGLFIKQATCFDKAKNAHDITSKDSEFGKCLANPDIEGIKSEIDTNYRAYKINAAFSLASYMRTSADHNNQNDEIFAPQRAKVAAMEEYTNSINYKILYPDVMSNLYPGLKLNKVMHVPGDIYERNKAVEEKKARDEVDAELKGWSTTWMRNALGTDEETLKQERIASNKDKFIHEMFYAIQKIAPEIEYTPKATDADIVPSYDDATLSEN